MNLGLAPKTIFNDSITNQRSYSTMSLPLADIKELGRRVGGTVNTIVMAMCSIALHHFLKERGLLPQEPRLMWKVTGNTPKIDVMPSCDRRMPTS